MFKCYDLAINLVFHSSFLEIKHSIKLVERRIAEYVKNCCNIIKNGLL